ncbi:hypothetical protein CL653_01955 [bacterium]|nr:hypothetical protein [bacterium]|tara:strand:+ start:192 stop:419 length:228 start_codon:yes stop_codon:yes gene_type:complete
MTQNQLEKKLDTLTDLVEAINGEIEAIGWDFQELKDNGDGENLSTDLNKFEKHLRKSANCLTHLKDGSFPDWGIN